ncbi:MAG TPA: N-acetyltransferase [Rhodospirillaceae bacterium]|nr:N-acetyltransferase [Rhodospirillaceae bacterium]
MSTNRDPILIDIPMPIITPRLMMRNVLPGDGAAMQEIKVESWNELCCWMPWTKLGVGTVDDAEKVIRENHAKYILREDMMVAAFTHDRRLIAMCGLHRFDWEFRSFEIGYYVRKSEHHKGYATELANALTRFAFGALNARRVIICAATENGASRRVIEKLGFGLESLTKADALLPDGSVTGHANYVRYDINDLPDLNVTWG